ncbi:CHAT domain-containing protein [Lentzea sp. NPDC005914]|uniref:CHAT domain-containing protein n=1 Tax=Lentzea sp. NPDC005914 TaxID=3154572 RepID=UPI0033CDE2CA
MPETEWTDDDVRRELAVMWERFSTNVNSVDPDYAGALAHAALQGYQDTEPDDNELDIIMRLLLHGSTYACTNPAVSAWRLSLAICHAELAERLKSLEHWQRAVDWGTFATDYPPADEEEAVDALLEVIDLHTGRVEAIQAAFRGEALDVHQALQEIGDTPGVMAKLADRLDHPTDRAIADVRRARVHGIRWFIGKDVTDLHEAVRVMTETVFLIPDGYWYQVEDLTMFGDLCLMQDKHDPSLVPVDQAVAAAEKAIALTAEDDPDLAEHHSLAALLLVLNEDPEQRDRIIEHMAGAAKADDPTAWAWYASGLQERGADTDSVADLLSAADWYRRSAEHPGADDAWSAWAQFVETHYQLHGLDQGPRHADIVIDCATELLKCSSPDTHAVATLHRYRLICAFQGGNRPGLAEFLRDHPFVGWLTDAEKAISGSDEPELLAAAVGLSWMWAICEAPNLAVPTAADVLAVLTRVRSLFRLALRSPGLDPDHAMLLRLFSQLNDNLLRVSTGDGDGDFSAFRELLANPAYATAHTPFTDMVGTLSGQVGLRSKALGPLRAAHRIFNRPVDEPRTELKQRELEATRLVYEMAERIQVDPLNADMLDLSTRAFEFVSELPATSDYAGLRSYCETFHRMIATAHSIPLGPRRFDQDLAYVEELMRPLEMGEHVAVALKDRDAGKLREICAELAARQVDPRLVGLDPGRIMLAAALDALVTLVPEDRAVLEQAIEANVERVAEIEKRYHPQMDSVAITLGKLLRRRNEPGDKRQSRKLGQDALWHANWYVLQQSSPEHALEYARNATTKVDELTAWCLEDDAIDDLIRVIDARRGLVLKAATTGHSLVDQLGEAGQADLARRWVETEGRDAPLLPGWDATADNFGGLRREVLRKLADGSEELIAPPSIREIQDALRVHGSEALVYLLPTNKRHSGQAVVVPVEGEAFASPLPLLDVEDAPQRYREAYDAWDTETSGPACERWREELGLLCDWAWTVAGGELLRLLGPDSRVVLVPVGPLGIVPWHAARDEQGRYLVQDMAISYAPSARLFCDVLKRAEVAEGKPVLVGNPARDLPAGAAEATAVRDAFYPDGVFLGGFSRAPRPWKPSPDGSGTPAQVLAALLKPLPLLHLACHAVADMRQPLQSHVKLATAQLSAVELLELSPVDMLPLGTVNLAGCTTNVSGVDYDEALSLATTFLAIGARTVVGSLWRVPAGRSTAHLMFMFYHYLRTERPAGALRRAQLWMLDDGREFPACMPDSLRVLPSAGFGPAEVESWAGFTQMGR